QGERLLPMPVGPGAPPITAASPATAPGSCGCTGGACGDGSDYRTVQEAGRAPMHCRILRRWRVAGNPDVCQCQCVGNGELLTLAETGPATPVADAPPGTRVTAIGTRIFHWGRNRTPPTGCPMPPDVTPTPVTSAPVIVSEIPIEGPIARERTPFGMRL